MSPERSFCLREKWPARSASPLGRSLKEGPDEGRFPALTRRFAPPSPGGRGTFPEQVSKTENPLKAESILLLERTAFPNWDRSVPSRMVKAPTRRPQTYRAHVTKSRVNTRCHGVVHKDQIHPVLTHVSPERLLAAVDARTFNIFTVEERAHFDQCFHCLQHLACIARVVSSFSVTMLDASPPLNDE